MEKKLPLFKLCLLGWSFLLLLGSCSKSLYNGEAAIPEEAVFPLSNEDDLDVLIQAIGDARVVLLGEASHGTSGFYTWRANISKRLIEEKNFTLIAIEGDWAEAQQLNDFIKNKNSFTSAEEALAQFDRWPTWMWANEEVASFAEWLRSYNDEKSSGKKIGFFGMDVYGIWDSLDHLNEFLEELAPNKAILAKEALNCFAPYDFDENTYAVETANSQENCADELAALQKAVRTIAANQKPENEETFNALQNARVAVHGEAYYRTAAQNFVAAWNIRDLHMTGTVDQLLKKYRPDSKIIVWAHNTHVGDAKATDMASAGLVNIGQLLREKFEGETFIVGFGTYRGKVIAANRWGRPSKEMNVPRAQRKSWEWLLHQHSPADKILIMSRLQGIPRFQKSIGHRAIGVEYDPSSEIGGYVPSVMPLRYDAFIFIDQSHALRPLD